jgi:outer membrane lipoprotein LolB
MLGGILNTLRNVFAVEVKVGKTIRAVSLTIGMVLLSACSTLSEVKTTSPEAERQWVTHRQDLEQFHSWVISGRLGIQTEDEGWHVSFHWQQGNAELYHINLSGPLGQESAELQGTAHGVTLLLSDGHSISAMDPDELLERQFGWHLPVKGLYYWVRGLPMPHTAETHALDGRGRLYWLKQAGWHISYRRYGDVAGKAFPTKIFLDSPQVKVRLVIDEWTLS